MIGYATMKARAEAHAALKQGESVVFDFAHLPVDPPTEVGQEMTLILEGEWIRVRVTEIRKPGPNAEYVLEPL